MSYSQESVKLDGMLSIELLQKIEEAESRVCEKVQLSFP